ncbi:MULTISPECIES: hypothetical protein [Aurantimicrobium]|jgi:hypothetical protein|uniref:MSP domain-containing protein n=1 Tax=Aurantimicrobium photophilum TaxID=1987356 RepID=A0A2Z3S6F6_9MICO|nr:MULTISPECIES: hypothetical protein [Aurantimicrobium]AWR22328.1 hypothetical protein AURMO_01746 [Aurantimicrobium photophilum]MDH6254845.1 hypothetical protein [Aurantimicrobium minutum]
MMKNKNIAKASAFVALAAATAISLSACSTAADEDSSANDESSESSQVVAPTIIDVATADGQTIDISNGGFVDITTGDTDPADWSAVISDPAVAAFTAGGKSGDAVMNPGLQGTAAGTTKVELTNKTTGQVVTFTVNVK